MPEAVYGPGKSPEQCVRIVGELLTNGSGPVLLTRATADVRDAVVDAHPAAQATATGSTTCLTWRVPDPWRPQRVLAISAGTADVPVLDEAVVTLRAYGFDPERITDVGVAGLHRLLAHLDQVTAADAIVVAAGMEGALASVIGGLSAAPVVAVPTSVGYGAGLDGVTALLAMHASCASGVTVVGIDNGFGAACAIARIFSTVTP
jgi:NCAIR mutase (PurE)-related protein